MHNILKKFFLLFIVILSFEVAGKCDPKIIDHLQVLKLGSQLDSALIINPKIAADMVMNTFYQNCEAASLPPYDIHTEGEMEGYQMVEHPWNGGSISKIKDLKKAQDSQYYTKCPTKEKSDCINLCKAPPTYIWGAKGIYQKNREVNLFKNEHSIEKISAHPGIDCSGFVNVVFALSGLKVRTDMPVRKVASVTPARYFMKPNECFKYVKSQEDFLPGDVISWKKHVVMVEKSSTDPFNLNNITTIKHCTSEYLDPLKFDLIVSNSMGGTHSANLAREFPSSSKALNKKAKITGVGVGISKVPLGHLAYRYPVEIMELAKSACYSKFGKAFNRENIQVTRHILVDQDPVPRNHACVQKMDERFKLKGIECLVENC